MRLYPCEKLRHGYISSQFFDFYEISNKVACGLQNEAGLTRDRLEMPKGHNYSHHHITHVANKKNWLSLIYTFISYHNLVIITKILNYNFPNIIYYRNMWLTNRQTTYIIMNKQRQKQTFCHMAKG